MIRIIGDVWMRVEWEEIRWLIGEEDDEKMEGREIVGGIMVGGEVVNVRFE